MLYLSLLIFYSFFTLAPLCGMHQPTCSNPVEVNQQNQESLLVNLPQELLVPIIYYLYFTNGYNIENLKRTCKRMYDIIREEEDRLEKQHLFHPLFATFNNFGRGEEMRMQDEYLLAACSINNTANYTDVRARNNQIREFLHDISQRHISHRNATRNALSNYVLKDALATLINRYGFATLAYHHLDTLARLIPENILVSYLLQEQEQAELPINVRFFDVANGAAAALITAHSTHISEQLTEKYNQYMRFLNSHERAVFIQEMGKALSIMNKIQSWFSSSPLILARLMIPSLNLPQCVNLQDDILPNTLYPPAHTMNTSYMLTMLILCYSYNLSPHTFSLLPTYHSNSNHEATFLRLFATSFSYLGVLFTHILKNYNPYNYMKSVTLGNTILHITCMQEPRHALMGTPINDELAALQSLLHLLPRQIINEPNNQGLTPLMLATIARKSEAFKNILIEHGARLEARDSNGNTALMMAVQSQNLNTVMLLLRNGASPLLTNNNGQSALNIARTKLFTNFSDHSRAIVAKLEETLNRES